MADDKHNGWTNYETWNVKLWIDNDEGSYRYWRDAAEEAFGDTNDDDSVDDRREEAALALRERLKDEIDEGNPLSGEASMYSDILNAALSDVNWYEIARAMVDELDPGQD